MAMQRSPPVAIEATASEKMKRKARMAAITAAIMPRIIALCALLSFFCIGTAQAQWVELYWADPALPWRTLQTEHFEVHFAERNREQARLAAGIAERVYVTTTRLLDWQPRRRTQLVILD